MTPLRIGIAKPSWGVHGGFEVVVARLLAHLEQAGHDVRILSVPAERVRTRAFDVEISPELADALPELSRYLSLNDEFSRIDAHRADLTISTQPPSFAVHARRHLSIFFHHARLFYDLNAVAAEAGMLTPLEAEIGASAVRAVDQPQLERVTHFLAGSPTVRARLRSFNHIDGNVGLFSAASGVRPSDEVYDPAEPSVLCVSRHEFPKRTELFVHAMSYLPSVQAVSVGTGGRLGWVQDVARRLDSVGDPDAVESRELWCCPAPWMESAKSPGPVGGVNFAGRLDQEALEDAYREATCVVAPALDEDYGLTALEAMAYGKPVIACADGGGLTDLVEHGVNGLVVEPTGRAIAAAIDELIEDSALRAELGCRGRSMSAGYTWPKAFAQVDEAIERMMEQ